MKRTAAEKNTPQEITSVLKLVTGQIECCVVGHTPLVMNRLSEKAKHELLLPHGPKTSHEKTISLKHDPVSEFRASPHTLSDEKAPTFLAMPTTAFKGALCSAALDMPGAKKAQIGRLTYIDGEYVSIYGLPRLFMRAVRMADQNRTPDIRTRVIIPEWAGIFRVSFSQPLIAAQAVANLLAAGGMIIGVGDGRPEKGKLNFGQFRLADKNDADFKRIVREGGRAKQISAMAQAVCYDNETTELLSWFAEEISRRKAQGRPTKAPAARPNGADTTEEITDATHADAVSSH